jgi:capsular polysaccharide biosynthesis protein
LDWSRGRITMRALKVWLRLSGDSFRRMDSLPEAEEMLAAAGFRILRSERRSIDWLWELMVIDASMLESKSG